MQSLVLLALDSKFFWLLMSRWFKRCGTYQRSDSKVARETVLAFVSKQTADMV